MFLSFVCYKLQSHLFGRDNLQHELQNNLTYLAANAIFAKVASLCLRGGDTGVDSLKCLPILTYGLELCALPKEYCSLLILHVLMKVF